jgi:hypothetical protein
MSRASSLACTCGKCRSGTGTRASVALDQCVMTGVTVEECALAKVAIEPFLTAIQS